MKESKAMKSNTDKINSLWKKIFENLVRLNNEHKIAILLSYHSKSGQLIFGPDNIKQKMKTAYNCSCPCSCTVDGITWEKAFMEDNLDLIHGVQQNMQLDPLGVEDIVSRVQSEDTLIALLPCRLDIMSYKQCSEWIRNQIVLNHKEQGKTGNRIGYGEDDWHPDFWLDDVFPWSSMRCNFNNLRARDYNGERNMVWFMKRVISERLTQKGIYDPELHVSKEMSEEEVVRKERRRGMHTRPPVLHNGDTDIENAVDEHAMNSDDDDDEINESNVSIVDHNNSIHNTSDVSVETPGLASPPPASSDLTSETPAPASPAPTGSSSPPPTSSVQMSSPHASNFTSFRDNVDGITPRRKRPSQLVENEDVEPQLPPRGQGTPPPTLPSSIPQPQAPLPPTVVRAPRQLPPRFPRRSVIQEPGSLPPKRPRKPVSCSTCSSPNCFNHATTSRPREPEPNDENQVRSLIVAGDLVRRFKELSMQNTISKKETGGLLFGELKNNQYVVDVLVIPKQVGGPDNWKTTDEVQLGNFSADNPRLILCGTIHTHPGFDARPSSVDLHQQYDLQVQQPSAIAVIIAPERDQSPFYTITPFGMSALRDCTADRTENNGFHLHRSIRRLYSFASNVRVDPSLVLNEVDQRYERQFQNV